MAGDGDADDVPARHDLRHTLHDLRLRIPRHRSKEAGPMADVGPTSDHPQRNAHTPLQGLCKCGRKILERVFENLTIFLVVGTRRQKTIHRLGCTRRVLLFPCAFSGLYFGYISVHLAIRRSYTLQFRTFIHWQ